jgi:hypothetical protein
MVDDRGQLYTIEGVAAAILMVFTAYLMLSSTTLYTPGETHVTEMQMEQLGNDALAMMDTSDGYSSSSQLETFIHNNMSTEFQNSLTSYLNARKPVQYSANDTFQFSANVTYRYGTNSIGTYPFIASYNYTGREHTVKVTRWVYVAPGADSSLPPQMERNRNQSVLLEVLLWRD